MARVLVVDDDLDLIKLLRLELTALGFDVHSCTSADEALAALSDDPPDVVVTDLQMPQMDGAELCARIVAGWPDVPVIVMTVSRSLDSAVSALRAGANEFILKPLSGQALGLRIDKVMQARALRREVKRLKSTLEATRSRDGILGASAAIQKVQALVDQVASSDAAVLITGEAGTGKKLVARALHERSKRRGARFEVLDCAGLTEARASFAVAPGGTLLLDNVADLSQPLQAKLQRELPSLTARVVASSRGDLDSEVQAGRFREDLRYALDVVRIHLPPLRARPGDILLLAQSFLDAYAARAGRDVKGISSDAARRLLAYSWPGNARELQTCMERAVALARYEEVMAEDLPEKIRDFKPSQVVLSSGDPSEVVPLAEVEKRYILQALQAFGGNKSLAARALGVGRKTLYRKLEEYGSEEQDDDDG